MELGPEALALFISCLNKRGLKKLDEVLLSKLEPHWNYGELEYIFQHRSNFGNSLGRNSLTQACQGPCYSCMYNLIETVDPTALDDGVAPLHMAAHRPVVWMG